MLYFRTAARDNDTVTSILRFCSSRFHPLVLSAVILFGASATSAREPLPDDLPNIPGPREERDRRLYDALTRPLSGVNSDRYLRSDESEEPARKRTKETKQTPPSASAETDASSASESPAAVPNKTPKSDVRTGRPPETEREGVGVKSRMQEPVREFRPPQRTRRANVEQKTAQERESRKAARKNTRQEQNREQANPEHEPAGQRKLDRAPEKQESRFSNAGTPAGSAAAGTSKQAAKSAVAASTFDRSFRYFAPEFYRGIYINSYVARTPQKFRPLFKKCRQYGVNTLVVDVQPRMPSTEMIRLARESGFYLVARVVVFEGGLKVPYVPEKHLRGVLKRAEEAAEAGFMEIQLDYIRFADRANIGKLSLSQRYAVITGILERAEDILRPHGVRIGADIFGRIPFNRNDRIGQKLEIFAPHLDTIYPMLYPSHFYGQPKRIADPYGTILDGQKLSIKRVGHQSRIIAYIQVFKMSVSKSGLSYENYIKRQIDAAKDSGGAGFIAWNARNHYNEFFRALRRHDQREQKQ